MHDRVDPFVSPLGATTPVPVGLSDKMGIKRH